MARLVNVDSTCTERQRHRRTVAEALHLLAAKRELDAEARDLAALIVFSLLAIHEGVERSAAAWDKRNYYIKADRLRAEWAWTDRYASRLANLIRGGDWGRLPAVLAEMAPRFCDVHVARLTRSPRLWAGACERLLGEQ